MLLLTRDLQPETIQVRCIYLFSGED